MRTSKVLESEIKTKDIKIGTPALLKSFYRNVGLENHILNIVFILKSEKLLSP